MGEKHYTGERISWSGPGTSVHNGEGREIGKTEIHLFERSFLRKQESRFSLSGFPLAWE